MSVDLKTLTPDTSLPTTGFLFGADSQASSTPSVYGTAAVATAVGLQFPAGAQATPSISTTGDNDTGIWFPAANTVAVSTNALERMRIDSSGNVGIGTSSPIDRLNVSDGTVNFQLKPISASSVGFFGIRTNHALAFTTNDVERMRITSTGNVGIGTSSPGAELEVADSSSDNDVRINLRANASQMSQIGASSTLMFFDSVGVKPITFITNSNERMRIDSSGNLLLGTTVSPTTGTQTLTIETGTAPTATPADTISVYSSDLSAGNTMLSIYTEGTSVNANTTAAATHRIAVRINGTVYYLLANTAA